MIPFRRSFGKLSGQFDAAEAALIADLVDQLRELLARRRNDAPSDPLVELTGIRSGPAQAPEDQALQRLLPDFNREDATESAMLRQLYEPELLAAKDSAARMLLDTLPPGGGGVRLDDEQAAAWMTCLNDLRLVLAERIGIETEDTEPQAVVEDPAGPAAAMYAAYGWLSAVLDSLVTANMGR